MQMKQKKINKGLQFIIVGILAVGLLMTTGCGSTQKNRSEFVGVAWLMKGKNYTISLSETVVLDMIWIKPGTFIMGSPEDELGRWNNETQHKVTLTQDYWLGKYEVTQAQYESVLGVNPSCFQGTDLPVEYVSWDDAKEFCRKLTEIERNAGRLPQGYEYTLPTEAQWEYACRAGTTTAFNNGTNIQTEEQKRDEPCPDLDEVGWYEYNSDEMTHPVGQKQPNAWGLYDMHGNVREWCLDWWGDYPTSSVTDPTGSSEGEVRILRGGCWDSSVYDCRSACQNGYYPNYYSSNYGFRVCLTYSYKIENAPKLQCDAVSKKAGERQHLAFKEHKDNHYTGQYVYYDEDVPFSADLTCKDGKFILTGVVTLPEPAKPEPFTMTLEGDRGWVLKIFDREFEMDFLISRQGLNYTVQLPQGVPLDIVWIDKGYWIGKYEVTQEQYQAIIGSNPSWFKGTNLPVEHVSWHDAMAFCDKLTEIEKAAGRLPAGYKYTLPTESQWIYCCLATTVGDYNVDGVELSKLAWYIDNSYGTTHPVGQKKPNAWGLYDMHGNVWEWCRDWFRGITNLYSSKNKPINLGSGLLPGRVLHGGGWNSYAGLCCTTTRIAYTPSLGTSVIGFRVCLSYSSDP